MNLEESLYASVKAWRLVTFKMAIPICRKALAVITSPKVRPVITLVFRVLIDKGILWKLRDYDLQRDKFAYEIAKEQNAVFYDIIQSTGKYIEMSRKIEKIQDQI